MIWQVEIVDFRAIATPMQTPNYAPPWFLPNGFLMTVYIALQAGKTWRENTLEPEPPYKEKIFTGAGGVPIFGIYAVPENPKGTIVATYGIVGDLDNQWFLRILGRKAFARGYAVLLFDWRAHGKTAKLSPTVTSDGLYEGKDFVYLASESVALGCPAPFWFSGLSLGGQLALWGVKEAQSADNWETDLAVKASDFAGGMVVCPSLDSNRSLPYLEDNLLGKQLEQAIARKLKQLSRELLKNHPQAFDPAALDRVHSIRSFDQELVIEKLGFDTVEAYYEASSAFQILPDLEKNTLILYAKDDPLFAPEIIPDLEVAARKNSAIDLWLTESGGHVGYISGESCQKEWGDRDPWWAWNRMLEWCDRQSI